MPNLKSFFSSEFARNVLTLMTGTTIAQAIPLAITPILTRLYTPEDFGVLALFAAIIAVLGGIANAKYELAIMLPKSNKEALNIVYLSVIIASCFSILLLLFVLLFQRKIILLLGEPQIGPWLYFVPLAVLSLGIYNAFLVYNNRLKYYKDMSISSVSKAFGQSSTQIGLGFLKFGAGGLVLGQVVSYITGNLVLIKNTFKHNDLVDSFDMTTISRLGLRYKKFPLFTLPGNFLNVFTTNAINFLVSNFYLLSTLGHFSLARRVLGMPTIILGSSLSSIYFQKITQDKNEGKNVLKVFEDTVKRLFFFSIPIFTLLYFVVKPVLVFVLGEQWEMCGVYAQIMVPLAGIRFISGAISATFNIFEKQQYIILINAILLISTIVVFYLGYSNGYDFEKTFTHYVAVACLNYVFAIYMYWRVTKQYVKNN